MNWHRASKQQLYVIACDEMMTIEDRYEAARELQKRRPHSYKGGDTKVTKQERLEILQSIDKAAANCIGCDKKRKMGKQLKALARAEQYCIQKCRVGKQLQKYGRQLMGAAK